MKTRTEPLPPIYQATLDHMRKTGEVQDAAKLSVEWFGGFSTEAPASIRRVAALVLKDLCRHKFIKQDAQGWYRA